MTHVMLRHITVLCAHCEDYFSVTGHFLIFNRDLYITLYELQYDRTLIIFDVMVGVHDRSVSGCRYGCVCHLCEPDQDIPSPPLGVTTCRKEGATCTKEYCRLGCICDSIFHRELANRSSVRGHCGKPECMFECVCPPIMASTESESYSAIKAIIGRSRDPQTGGTKTVSSEAAVATTSSAVAAPTVVSSQTGAAPGGSTANVTPGGSKTSDAPGGSKTSVAPSGSNAKAGHNSTKYKGKRRRGKRRRMGAKKPILKLQVTSEANPQETQELVSEGSIRKSSRLKDRQGIGAIDTLNSLIFFDTSRWLNETDTPRTGKKKVR